MTSEQQARTKIDKVREHAVLLFQDYKELNLSVGVGIVVREHLTDSKTANITSERIQKETFSYRPFVNNDGMGRLWKLFRKESNETINKFNNELAT